MRKKPRNSAGQTTMLRLHSLMAGRSAWTFLASLTMVLALCFTPISAKQKAAPRVIPMFSELSREDRTRLDQQRAIIAAAANRRYGTPALTRKLEDLKVLQRLIDDKAFDKKQTYELQSLGVAFGDVLASELPLRWVMVTDEYGTDPTLRFKNTTVQINALTMISKRVEKNEKVSLTELLNRTRQELKRISENGSFA